MEPGGRELEFGPYAAVGGGPVIMLIITGCSLGMFLGVYGGVTERV